MQLGCRAHQEHLIQEAEVVVGGAKAGAVEGVRGGAVGMVLRTILVDQWSGVEVLVVGAEDTMETSQTTITTTKATTILMNPANLCKNILNCQGED